MKRVCLIGVILFGFCGSVAFADMPATSTYKLNSYGFGSGGTANSGTSNYALEGITGEVSGQTASTSVYSAKPGFIETQQANVPKITLTNPSNYYDKLHFVIDEQGNPTDALYAMRVCIGGDFPCGGTTYYVKSDNTLSTTLTLSDYQTSAVWVASLGNINGLSSSTTYYIQAKATQGKYTESGWGPSSNAATVGQSISFCLYAAANCAGAGSSVAFGNLLPATVTNSSDNIGVDFATNADFGGSVYIYSTNGGLSSTTAGHTITSATADLGTADEGFGGQIASVTQTSGGPFTKGSTYNLSGTNVGAITTTIDKLYNSANPITGGNGFLQLKARASSTTAAATDYGETVTVIAAASF